MTKLTVLDAPVSPDAVDPAMDMRADRVLNQLQQHPLAVPTMCEFVRDMFLLCPGIDTILKPKLTLAGGVYAEVATELDRPESQAA